MAKVPVKRGRLSEAEIATIAELGERGLNAGQIALRLGGRSASTIYWRLLLLGLAKPKQPAASKPYLRKGVLITPFSAEEDAFIRALRVQDYSTPKIAELCTKRCGHRRTAHSVHVRLVMLSAYDEAGVIPRRAA